MLFRALTGDYRECAALAEIDGVESQFILRITLGFISVIRLIIWGFLSASVFISFSVGALFL